MLIIYQYAKVHFHPPKNRNHWAMNTPMRAQGAVAGREARMVEKKKRSIKREKRIFGLSYLTL